MINIEKHLGFYGNIAQINQLQMMIMQLSILMKLILLPTRLKYKKKEQIKQAMMAQKW